MCSSDLLDDVSLDIRGGEIVAIMGSDAEVAGAVNLADPIQLKDQRGQAFHGLALEDHYGIDVTETANGYVGGDERHKQRNAGDSKDILPAHQDNKLWDCVLCERRQQDGNTRAQQEAQNSGDHALLKYDPIEVRVRKPLSLQYPILTRLLDGRGIDGQAGNSEADDEGDD